VSGSTRLARRWRKDRGEIGGVGISIWHRGGLRLGRIPQLPKEPVALSRLWTVSSAVTARALPRPWQGGCARAKRKQQNASKRNRASRRSPRGERSRGESGAWLGQAEEDVQAPGRRSGGGREARVSARSAGCGGGNRHGKAGASARAATLRPQVRLSHTAWDMRGQREGPSCPGYATCWRARDESAAAGVRRSGRLTSCSVQSVGGYKNRGRGRRRNAGAAEPAKGEYLGIGGGGKGRVRDGLKAEERRGANVEGCANETGQHGARGRGHALVNCLASARGRVAPSLPPAAHTGSAAGVITESRGACRGTRGAAPARRDWSTRKGQALTSSGRHVVVVNRRRRASRGGRGAPASTAERREGVRLGSAGGGEEVSGAPGAAARVRAPPRERQRRVGVAFFSYRWSQNTGPAGSESGCGIPPA
jgi:hypothetical protein